MAYTKTENYNEKTTLALQKNYTEILSLLGEDAQREGLQKTPERIAKAMQFLTQGYEQDAEKIINSALFEENTEEMVIIKDIEFYSMCEHHMLPFFGKVHLAYCPNKKIVGLSKLPRIVEAFARRLQVQERFTKEVVAVIQKTLAPKGIAIVVEAQHLCMMMRGVNKTSPLTITSAFHGCFEEEQKKNDFLKLIQKTL